MTAASHPNNSMERALMAEGHGPVCGVDEVGRGPLAGPVTAAAVILDPARPIPGLADSKKLSPKKRQELFDAIQAGAVAVSVGYASVEEIDRLNILHAALLAMSRAVRGLETVPGYALIDGNKLPPQLAMPARAVVKGDGTSVSIAAASIIAKVTRDRIMRRLDARYPGYGLAQHAGYPTKAHKEALLTLGPSPVHRRSFKPVRAALERLERRDRETS